MKKTRKKPTVILKTASKQKHKRKRRSPGLDDNVLKDTKLWFLSILAHMYLIIVISTFHSIENDLQEHTGLSKMTVINYILISSILILIASLSINWSWPILSEQALIIAFIWILYSNLLSSECICCENNVVSQLLDDDDYNLIKTKQITEDDSNDPYIHLESSKDDDRGGGGGGGEELDEIHKMLDKATLDTVNSINSTCSTSLFSGLYSGLFIIILLFSFFIDVKYRYLSILFMISSSVVFFILLLIPNNCNQFNFISMAVLFVKLTIYHIIWYTNRFMRVTEAILYSRYRIIWYNEKHGVIKSRNKHPTPMIMFKDLKSDFTEFNVLNNNRDVVNNNSVTNRVYTNTIALSNRVYRESNILEKIVSWKNRNYDEKYMFIIDLMRSIWVLAVCPLFLILSALQIIWMWYTIHKNRKEIAQIKFVAKNKSQIV